MAKEYASRQRPPDREPRDRLGDLMNKAIEEANKLDVDEPPLTPFPPATQFPRRAASKQPRRNAPSKS